MASAYDLSCVLKFVLKFVEIFVLKFFLAVLRPVSHGDGRISWRLIPPQKLFHRRRHDEPVALISFNRLHPHTYSPDGGAAAA